MAFQLNASSHLLILTLLGLTVTLSCAKATISPSIEADFAKEEAERLIRSFNLSPKESVNIVHDNTIGPPGLVERRFRFPGLVDRSNVSIADLGHHAGYYPIKHSYDAKMFYFFFESRGSKDDPVVIWLTGGPGCSSELALFYENGPFKIKGDLTLRWNDFGWDTVSAIVLRSNETGVANDLYDFLQAFFQGHPEFVNNDFYITGESYAGHYIPALASRVDKGNKANEGIHINLKGFAVGNGFTDPEYQYPAYTDFALANKLISQSDYAEINEQIPECVQEIKACQTEDPMCNLASMTCTQIVQDILSIAGNINYYDIRKPCVGQMCYDFSSLENLLNQDSVRKALGVGDIEFVSCSKTVHMAMRGDWMKNYEVVIPSLLEEGMEVLLYAGEYDFVCNWMGNSKWVNAMAWSGQDSFVATNTTAYIVDGKEAGLVKSSGPLTFLKVHDAGHLVPMDQPNVSLQMIKGWMTAASKKGRVPAKKQGYILP